MKLIFIGVAIATFGLSGCQSTTSTASSAATGPEIESVAKAEQACDPNAKIDPLAGMRGEAILSEACISEISEAASVHPLGSRENPIRVYMPAGQREYLSRLRCSDGNPPEFVRVGNYGAGIYRSIIDGYQVTCASGLPEDQVLFLDMYHPGHKENRVPEGYDIDTPIHPRQDI